MDVSNVFIIFGIGWNKHKVVHELKSEGYKHNFFFAQGQDYDILVKELSKSDEVWTFGDCVGQPMYGYAKKINSDIWKMG